MLYSHSLILSRSTHFFFQSLRLKENNNNNNFSPAHSSFLFCSVFMHLLHDVKKKKKKKVCSLTKRTKQSWHLSSGHFWPWDSPGQAACHQAQASPNARAPLSPPAVGWLQHGQAPQLSCGGCLDSGKRVATSLHACKAGSKADVSGH